MPDVCPELEYFALKSVGTWEIKWETGIVRKWETKWESGKSSGKVGKWINVRFFGWQVTFETMAVYVP
jgi:hypothetical protein